MAENQKVDLYLAVDEERDHIQGSPGARVTLVQYGDYECPYTRQSNAVVRQLQQQFGDDLRFVYRNFPLRKIHPHAQLAAEAAEAAAAQGKFWEMHDHLFHRQKALEEENLRQYAAEVGLNQVSFAEALVEHTFADRVEEDLMSGVASGVQGTPTFFVNGMRHDDYNDLPELSAAVKRAIS